MSAGVWLFAMIPLLLLRTRKFRRFLYSQKHLDGQREILSYIYSINGFVEEANLIYSSNVDRYYWAESDFFTSKCLESNDKDKIRRAIKTLDDLIIYADIEHTSCLIIHFNIARLGAAIEANELAAAHLRLAKEDNHKVIEKRIQMDPVLVALESR